MKNKKTKRKNFYLYEYQIKRVEKYAKKIKTSGSIVIQQLIDELPE